MRIESICIEGPNCWCRYCENEYLISNPDDWRYMSGMIVCPTCGNKRCPHASHHDHGCTRSNESGQAGSVYGDFKLDESWAEKDW